MDKIKKLLNKLFSFFPSKLPIGVKEFEGYSHSIFTTWNIPELPSYQNALATMIMHLPQTQSRKAKYYFVKVIRKSQANQVAYEMIQKYREEEKQREATPQLVNGAATHEEVKPISDAAL